MYLLSIRNRREKPGQITKCLLCVQEFVHNIFTSSFISYSFMKISLSNWQRISMDIKRSSKKKEKMAAVTDSLKTC